jgi:hypothetical protein
MAAPDATRQEVRYRLLDLDLVNPLLSDNAALDSAISQATTKYSQDRPYTVVEDELGNGTPFFVLVGVGAVLASWVDGFSDIQSIDYPAAAISATYQPTWLEPGEDWTAYRDASKTYLWLRNAAPTASETVRITYTVRHTHTSALDTVPAADSDALWDLSAHCACVMLATKMAASSDSTMGADSVNHRDGQLRFKQQAEMWLQSYAERLGLATDGSPAGASANADWDSRNIQIGRRWLTHGRGR